MTKIYRAGFQLLKVRAVTWFSLACAVGACWYGWDLLQTLGLRPADGGVLQPFAIRLLVGGFVAALGLAFAFGMWVYIRRYVSSLAYDPGSDRLIIRTPGFFLSRARSVAPSEIEGTSFQRGDFVNPLGVSVNAPWHALELKGRRGWYIIDAQGRWLDPALAERLLFRESGPAPPRARRTRGKRGGKAAAKAPSSEG